MLIIPPNEPNHLFTIKLQEDELELLTLIADEWLEANANDRLDYATVNLARELSTALDAKPGEQTHLKYRS